MKDKVLAVLKNTDGYVSGQELCEELGVKLRDRLNREHPKEHLR